MDGDETLIDHRSHQLPLLLLLFAQNSPSLEKLLTELLREDKKDGAEQMNVWKLLYEPEKKRCSSDTAKQHRKVFTVGQKTSTTLKDFQMIRQLEEDSS